MTTEAGPNPADFRANLRAKLGAMPPVGPQGRERPTPPAEDAEPLPTQAAAVIQPPAPPMKPNPAQGASAGPVVAPQAASGATALDRIREAARDIARIDYDPTVA
jgi:hypothetical protein